WLRRIAQGISCDFRSNGTARTSRERFDGWARAEEVAITVRIVDPADAWPEFGRPNKRQRKCRLFTRIGVRPVGRRDRFGGVRRVLEHVVDPVGLSGDHGFDLAAYLNH